MADRRIYAGYYRRYDGKLIYVVTVAKDADTDEEMVVWTPATYSEKQTPGKLNTPQGLRHRWRGPFLCQDYVRIQ